jgi:hypothetical protein
VFTDLRCTVIAVAAVYFVDTLYYSAASVPAGKVCKTLMENASRYHYLPGIILAWLILALLKSKSNKNGGKVK